MIISKMSLLASHMSQAYFQTLPLTAYIVVLPSAHERMWGTFDADTERNQ